MPILAEARIVSVIKKGTILTCPKDNQPILKLKNDINLYSEFEWENFDFLEEYPKDIKKKIPCEVIKSECFHVKEGWIGFSDECSLIPSNAGMTFKEFINYERGRDKTNKKIHEREFDCQMYYEKLKIEMCISKDLKYRCLKSPNYNTENNFGPCEKL